MKIIMPVEDEKFANTCIEFIGNHEWDKKTSIEIVYAINPVSGNTSIGIMPEVSLKALAASKKFGERLVSSVRQRLLSRFAEDQIAGLVIEGRPAEVIVDQARQRRADLIIMGSHGRRGLSRLFLGSVSLEVLAKAPCSVMIARPTKSTGKKESGEKVLIALEDEATEEAVTSFLTRHLSLKKAHFSLLHVINYDKGFLAWPKCLSMKTVRH